MKYGLLLALCWLMTFETVSAQPPITNDVPLRARQAPGFGALLAYEIPSGAAFDLLGLAPDGEWVQVRYDDQRAWVPLNQVDLPRGWQARFVAEVPTAPPPNTARCVSLVGDSVAHGTVVYVVPGHGFGVLRTTPLAEVLSETLQASGLGYVDVRDRTNSAAFLSDEARNPYRQMEAFALLQEDDCVLTVIMPWINDMSLERDHNAQAHIDDLSQFIEDVRAANPAGHILVLGFYFGEPSDFAAQHAPGYTDANITRFNAALDRACTPDGPLGMQPNVTCMPLAPLYAADNAHVVRDISRERLLATLYDPIPADVAPLFEVYWRDNPAAPVYGDGVHLNEDGKRQLSDVLVQTFLRLIPDL